MDYTRTIWAMLLFGLISFTTYGQESAYNEAESFFPQVESLNNDAITWGFLTVPENWKNPKEQPIKIAVTVLKSVAKTPNANAIVFLQGGPGASGVESIWNWVNHPLRAKNDIVLFDIRGTGFSQPRLCKELGREFLKILAKNQTSLEDENQKTKAALNCKASLLGRDIDVNEYNSQAIAKDLHALKDNLGYTSWSVYGVSYGTYMAQVYASEFPNDVNSLLLDSAILDISSYYTQNTSNYMNSLSKLFKLCEQDQDCSQKFPELEKVYYQVIDNLKESPITVKVDEKFLETGEFTFNAEDFKVIIQQALYKKQFVEALPLIIYQFKNRNKGVLGNLVPSIATLLYMDYGVYYSVSCNEVLPNNDFAKYTQDGAKYNRLAGGISFYKSDFQVCDQWNKNRIDSLMVQPNLSTLSNAPFPTLVFSGEYDPITPASSAQEITDRFNKSYAIHAHSYGHTPSFSVIGNNVAQSFVNEKDKTPNLNAFNEATKVDIIDNVKLNSGVSKMGLALGQFNPVFMLPVVIAVLILLYFIVSYTIKLIKKNYAQMDDKIVRVFSVITSILAVVSLLSLAMTIMKVAGKNSVILAFGLPENFSYIFTIIMIFIGFLILTSLFFIIRLKKINDRSVLFSVIFSNTLLLVYFFYWGIL